MRIQHGDKGFFLTFANGHTLSIQYGISNYCDRRITDPFKHYEPVDSGDIVSSNFEMAVIDPNGKFLPLGNDSVRGWVPFDHLSAIINLVSNSDFQELVEYLDKVA